MMGAQGKEPKLWGFLDLENQKRDPYAFGLGK
jgi:hypothetical protein